MPRRTFTLAAVAAAGRSVRTRFAAGVLPILLAGLGCGAGRNEATSSRPLERGEPKHGSLYALQRRMRDAKAEDDQSRVKEIGLETITHWPAQPRFLVIINHSGRIFFDGKLGALAGARQGVIPEHVFREAAALVVNTSVTAVGPEYVDGYMEDPSEVFYVLGKRGTWLTHARGTPTPRELVLLRAVLRRAIDEAQWDGSDENPGG